MLIKNSRLTSGKLFSTCSSYKDKDTEKDIITDVTEVNKILNEWGYKLEKKYEQSSSTSSKSSKSNTTITQKQNYKHSTNTRPKSNSHAFSRHNLLERSKKYNTFNKLNLKT